MPGSLEAVDVGLQIPYHFRCPISLEIMGDPVAVCTGQTYDRSSIESWVATGNTTCPVTRMPLTDFTLIPNLTVRRLIQEWCESNHSFGVERIPTPVQPADPIVVQNLLNQVSSSSSPSAVKVAALKRIRGLALDSEKNRSVLEANSVKQILLPLTFSDIGVQPSEIKLESLSIVSMFPLSETECSYVVSDLDRVRYLVNLLFHSSIDVRVQSAAVIETVARGIRSQDLRGQISSVDGVFEGIIRILKDPLSYPRALKIGIKALFALCLVKQHRHLAVAAGSVEPLIDRLPELEKCDAERALATIELLCRIPSGCAAFASHALAVPLLVNIIRKISDRATEYAAGALLSLCSASDRAQTEAMSAGAMTQLLLLVQSDCTERAKRKAQMLLKLLRNSWPHDVIAITDDFAGSDVVPF